MIETVFSYFCQYFECQIIVLLSNISSRIQSILNPAFISVIIEQQQCDRNWSSGIVAILVYIKNLWKWNKIMLDNNIVRCFMSYKYWATSIIFVFVCAQMMNKGNHILWKHIIPLIPKKLLFFRALLSNTHCINYHEYIVDSIIIIL